MRYFAFSSLFFSYQIVLLLPLFIIFSIPRSAAGLTIKIARGSQISIFANVYINITYNRIIYIKYFRRAVKIAKNTENSPDIKYI